MLTINGKISNLQKLDNGKINENNYSDFEKRVIEVINKWNSGEQVFIFETSGSTGEKTSVELSRNVMEYSACATLNKLDKNRTFKRSLIAINPFYIGGTMALIRALIAGHEIEYVDPSSNPLQNTLSSHFDLVSLVPLQVQKIFDEDSKLFHKVSNVIIGGASLTRKYIDLISNIESTEFFHSYGMTETASHFGLQNLKSQECFETIGDVSIDVNENDCLKARGTVTDQRWIQTNDIVEMIDRNHFKWIARADNVINSGGVKILPEEIESKLENQIALPFFVAGIPDDQLGSKIVLLIQSDEKIQYDDFNFSQLSRYSVPKDIFTLSSFVFTETNKINRKETLKLLK